MTTSTVSSTVSDVLEAYDSSYVPKPYGHENTGVICHLNALLQGLAGCPAVIKAVLTNRDYLGRTATGRAVYDYTCTACPEPAAVHKSVHFGPVRPIEYCSHLVLMALTTDLRERRPSVKYGASMESASEGLVLLLDMLDDPSPRKVGEEIDNTGKKSNVYEENPVSRLFYHRFNAMTYCKECKVCVSEDLDLGVQINLFHYDSMQDKPNTPAQYGKMLRSHVSYLNDYTCNKCGKKAGGYRHYSLRMVPEIVVCVYNLYLPNYLRPLRYYPDRIPLPGVGGSNLIYRLVAQVEHYGQLNSGHYIARGLRSDDRVYHFDDRSYLENDFKRTPNVYMIFYHHEESRKPPEDKIPGSLKNTNEGGP